MIIEHVALYVSQLDEAKDFFETYFDANTEAYYHNPTTDFRSYFLSFSEGARLELMERPEMEDGPKHPFRTGYAHIAMSLGSAQKVDALTQRLVENGYELVSGPRTTGDGYYESVIVDLEGNLVEITI